MDHLLICREMSAWGGKLHVNVARRDRGAPPRRRLLQWNLYPGEDVSVLRLGIDRQPNVLGSARASVHDQPSQIRCNRRVRMQDEERREGRERVIDAEDV